MNQHQHIHLFFGPTTEAVDHVHHLAGRTGPAIPGPGGHVHAVLGMVTTTIHHSHAFSTWGLRYRYETATFIISTV